MDFTTQEVILGYLTIVRSLYTSADMEEDLTITLQPVDGFQHMRCQSGVVFHAQSNGAKGDRRQKVARVPGIKRYQWCLSQKLRRSTWGQGFLMNSFQIELDS